MRKPKLIILILFVAGTLLFSLGYRKQSHDVPLLEKLSRALSENLDNFLQKALYKNVKVGILLATVDGKHELYVKNREKTFITASAFKIFPSAISLVKFGPDYRFSTPISMSGSIRGNTLNGNIYIQGRGDTSLKISDLQKAVDELKKKGITRIDGDIIYDISFFDEEKSRYAPNARNLYAPPCALTLEYNWIDVKIINNNKPMLKLVPESSYAKLSYDIKISGSAEPGRPDMTYQQHPRGDHYFIKGTITGWDRRYHYVWLGVSRPGLYTASMFRELCEKANIIVNGKIKKSIGIPGGVKTLYNINSGPLSEIVRIMNQESNNVIAENMNKNLGAYFLSVPGTRNKGLKVIERFCVEELGFSETGFSVGDASGLSVKNRISPEQFIRALNYFYKEKNIRKAFIPSLARQGHHPHAMIPVPPDDIKVYVKTGTLSVSGVNTVVGYIVHEKLDEVFSFAILANRNKPGPMTYSGTLTNPLLIRLVDVLKSDRFVKKD